MQTETTVFNLFFMPSCLAGAHSNNEKASFCLIYPNDSFPYITKHSHMYLFIRDKSIANRGVYTSISISLQRPTPIII